MKKKQKMILDSIASLWIAMPLYIFLHEGGHALVAILCGAKIVDFNLLEAYVVAEGGNFNEITLALFNIAGMLTPAIFLMIYLMFYKKNSIQPFYRIFSAVFSGIVLFSIGVWIVLPIMYMLHRANPNDDVTKFIEVLKINPIVVMVLASLLIGICMLCAWRKKVFQNGYETMYYNTHVDETR